ncbi:E3 ubiquitin-protein ligase RNF180 [Melanotaenia boesemani]|uniref:E3 ubiquitin-protein ligase RNF180 n=1 Tax=Melanotaenia boesemani TaxID=1250792 RepID=UPI001C050A82|nr:E3 ubiquitin-protein ligase RNF180 [Melanotaenia boesemani]XP_041826335.1 E3 ubiquitin-protein ligase RNF180 [Melanotaenia boesemani]XP_041826336.1 E3 ubiquitin-protein ligase RNF180 [Melanotaenia boesemani]
MLRCRRCRKSVLDLTCLSTAADEGSSAGCTIFHVNVDKLPEWMLTSVHQAHWTVGKLNCYNCGARLGGFNFLNRTECPCGQDATVHLNKSRVDQDHRHYVLSVQPRRTEPGRRHAGLLTDGSRSRGERPQMNRTALDSLQLNCTAVMSHISPDTRHQAENTQPFSFSPFYCISHRRRCSLEAEGDFRSCFCPVGPVDMSTVDLMRTGSSVSYPDDEALINVAPRRSAISGGVRSQMHQQLQPAEEDEDSNAVLEEVSDSVLSFRRRSVSDGAAELEEEVLLQASVVFPASIRLSKREKNRLKSQRRKQRRREKWLHSQLEKEQTERVTGSPSDGEEEGGEGLTCAVCLDIYFSPYSCQPCGHVFCEPCLRTLAKNRPTNTPCPLCRTLISHTSFHEELNQTTKTFFPKVHVTRKQNFQNASCAKWPLPSFRKNFRSFWEYQRNAATAGRGGHAAHRGFTLEALQFNDMCSWLFDIGLVIICVHSFNWILAFLLFSVLLYYFF